MSGRSSHALMAAVDLLRMPSKVRAMRASPLPTGILLLLRLAAEEAEAQSEACEISKRARDAHRDAAVFFIEQILLASSSDSYRILGLDKTATSAELRRHMVFLLKWLHPDRHGDPHKARLARRVLFAWNELKLAKRSNDGSIGAVERCVTKKETVLRRPIDGSPPQDALRQRRSRSQRRTHPRFLAL